MFYQKENKLDSAHYFHFKALMLSKKSENDNQEIGISLNKIGVVYYYKGNLDSAIVFFEKSIPYYTDQNLKANSINNLATMLKHQSKPDKAIKNYILALNIYEAQKDTSKQVFVLNNIGGLYNDLSDYTKANEYLNKGVLLAKKSFNKEGEYLCKNNLVNTLIAEKNYDDAIYNLQESIEYFEKTEQYNFLIVCKNNLANCFDGKGEKERALSIYLDIIKIIDKTGIENSKEAFLINISSSYTDLEDYDKALSYGYKALSFSKKNNLVLRYEPIYENLSL